jgi:predicted  nucleic acid-binding Zn-ribbon protein
MASAQKISQLTTAGPLTGAELLPIVQSGGTLQTTVSTLVAFANVSLIPVVSALQTQIAQVSALTSINAAAITSLGGVVATYDSRIDTVSAAVVSIGAVVSALEVRVSAASATGASNTAAITSVNDVVSALEVRVSAVSAVASALDVRISNVSASVSVLNVQMAAVQASISAINSVLATIDTSAITGLEARVSALEIRVTDVSALTSANTAAIASVNAVVSLKVFRNDDHLTNVQYIDFNTTTSYAASAGRLTWDIESGTLDLGLTGTVNLLIGQRTVAQIYNNSGVTLSKGKAVKVTGASGQRLTGALAQADSDSDSMTIFGVMLETVSNLGTGYVATDGLVKNVNTGAYADGDIVYLSPVSAGELTPTKPIAPQHLVQMGYVVKGNSVGGGSLYIKVQNGYELGELHNVKTSAEASTVNGEVLIWNASASVWTNSTALIDTQASVSALNIELAAVSARTSVNAAAITSINNVVSVLEVRVSSVSALASANAVAIAAVAASVSVLQIQVNAVSAALTSTNNVVSALEVRVSTVSAATSAVQVQVNAVSVQVSALQVQVNAVSAAVSAVLVSVGQRVLKAGDTMSGELNMADNLITRPKFKDYALQAVLKGNVSATTTLDLLEANYFQVTAAGSTTFVFANPPVSSANGPAAGGFILELANGGAATVTWPTATKWPSATAPTLTSSGTDILVFVTDDGGTTWRGVQSIKDSR